MKSDSLDVFMNSTRVGQLTQLKSGLVFKNCSAWLNKPNAIPLSLSIPLLERNFEGEMVESYFDNLLPDSLDLRQKIASLHGCQNTCFQLLKKK